MNIHGLTLACLVAGLTYFLSTSRALAYIDPGTGSMILQALVAGILAVGVFGRRIWDFLFHRGKTGRTDDDDSPRGPRDDVPGDQT